ncbi:MAG: hypothetical protein WC505_01480 [Patescibacteria group bacterium]
MAKVTGKLVPVGMVTGTFPSRFKTLRYLNLVAAVNGFSNNATVYIFEQNPGSHPSPSQANVFAVRSLEWNKHRTNVAVPGSEFGLCIKSKKPLPDSRALYVYVEEHEADHARKIEPLFWRRPRFSDGRRRTFVDPKLIPAAL